MIVVIIYAITSSDNNFDKFLFKANTKQLAIQI